MPSSWQQSSELQRPFRQARATRALTLDGAVFRVARAGGEASDLRLDMHADYREPRSGGPLPTLTRHETVKIPGGKGGPTRALPALPEVGVHGAERAQAGRGAICG